MKLSNEAIYQLRLTMKALGCTETTSTRMKEGNLRFLDNDIRGQKIEYVIYPEDGVVRRVVTDSRMSFGCWSERPVFTRLNPIARTNTYIPPRRYPYPGRWRTYAEVIKFDDPTALLLLAVRAVVNYRNKYAD